MVIYSFLKMITMYSVGTNGAYVCFKTEREYSHILGLFLRMPAYPECSFRKIRNGQIYEQKVLSNSRI